MATRYWPPYAPGMSLESHIQQLHSLIDNAAAAGQNDSLWHQVYVHALTFSVARTESEDEPMYLCPLRQEYLFSTHSRTPKFFISIHSPGKEVIMLVLSDAKAPPLMLEGLAEADVKKAYDNAFDMLAVETLEHAQWFFRRYERQNAVFIMVAVGLRVQFLKYERDSTPGLDLDLEFEDEDEDEDYDNAPGPLVTGRASEIPVAHSVIFDLLNDDKSDYSTLFEQWWISAKDGVAVEPQERGSEPTSSSSDEE